MGCENESDRNTGGFHRFKILLAVEFRILFVSVLKAAEVTILIVVYVCKKYDIKMFNILG